MKKSFLSILLVAFLTVISGCADSSTGSNTGTGTNDIFVDYNILNTNSIEFGKVYEVTIPNPERSNVTEEVFPILILNQNDAADLVFYMASNQNVNTTCGYDCADSTAGQSLSQLSFTPGTGFTSTTEPATQKRYIVFGSVSGNTIPAPTQVDFTMMFLTEQEMTDLFDTRDMNAAYQLGAVRQYKWTASDSNTGTGSGSSFDITNIPVIDGTFALAANQGNGAAGDVTFTNPRTEAGTYYPILLSNLMGLYTYNAVLTSEINASTLIGDLTLGNQNYNLNSATPIDSASKYRLTVYGNIPTDGMILVVFLTKEEEEHFFNVDALTQSIIDELIQLGAIQQYKFTVQ